MGFNERHWWITSTPYAMLPLFASKFAECTGGIQITFIEPYIIWSDIKFFVWDIYSVHLVRWILLTCFPCICYLELPDISLADLLRFEHRTSLFSCICMSMLTQNSGGNMQNHGYFLCFPAAPARENISWVWGIGYKYYAFFFVHFLHCILTAGTMIYPAFSRQLDKLLASLAASV